MAPKKPRKSANSAAQEAKLTAASGTQPPAPPSSEGPDYGREALHRCNFFRGRGPIEPGVFLRATEMWTWEPVAETSIDYRAIALDRSPSDRSPGYMRGLRSTHVFDPPRHLGYEVWEVDQHQSRHPDPKIARIVDLCDALSDEHARFRKFKLWEGSGYLAPSEDDCGVSYYEGPSGLPPPARDVQYICRYDVPEQAHRIVSLSLAVYSSHLRVEPPPGYEDLHGLGIAGPLSVAGQLVCLWAVLRDRLRELLRRPGVVGTAVHLQRLVACDRQPIDWTDEERGWLEAAKAEAQALGGSTGGAGHDAEARTSALPADPDPPTGPSLTANHQRVLKAMARFDASQLLSVDAIATETADLRALRPLPALSVETVRTSVLDLIREKLAERPRGSHSGTRLTTAGRRTAGKIAD